jgi:uncharacterized membrane protein
LFLLSPLGKLQEAPFWLYAVQDCVLAATLTLLYKRIVELKEDLRTAKALLILILLTHPFWFGLKYYEFHELSFAPLAMMLLLLAWEKKNPWLILISATALLCIKETTFFTLAWFGFILVVSSKKRDLRITGVLVFCLAVAFWLIYFKMVLPQIAGRSESMFSRYYGHLGQSMLEIVLSPVQKPTEFLRAIFTPSNAAYIFVMFGLCFPVFDKARHWVWLLPVLPDFLVALLSRYEGIRNPGFQYAGLVVVPIMFCAISGYSAWSEWSTRRRQLTTAWVVAVALSTISVNPLKIWMSMFWGAGSTLASREFVEHLRAVPKADSIVVTDDPLLPFTGQRDNLIWISKTNDRMEIPAYAQWAAFKFERLTFWRQQCSLPIHEWQGYVLCKLR